MKTLYLIRHSKSDWANTSLADIDRPLNSRGYNDAHFMSKILKEKNCNADKIISSSAVRAISTALIFSRTLNFDSSKINIVSSIYNADVEKYISEIGETPAAVNSLMFFAHNPEITECANILAGLSIEDIPTTGIVCIINDCTSWDDFVTTRSQLLFFEFPKNHL